MLSGIAPTSGNYLTGYNRGGINLSESVPAIGRPATTESPAVSGLQAGSTVQTVDPVIFDILLNNETNRRLKKNFGIAFVSLTTLFALISYGIIIFAAVYQWQLPPVSLIALAVEAPLQMIGILYIMARNLFPTIPVSPPPRQAT